MSYIIKATYNITSLTTALLRVSSVQDINSIEVDGVYVDKPKSTGYWRYTFATTGEHTLNIEINTTSLSIFNNIDSVTKVILPQGIQTFEANAFVYCENLTTVNIPDTVTSIGSDAFFGSGITSIEIPSSVTSVGYNILRNCKKLNSIAVSPDNPVFDSRNNCNCLIRTEDNELLSGCVNSIIPDTVEIIGKESFEETAITSINIPNSVTFIDYGAFVLCQNLKRVTIGNGLVRLGPQVFNGCSNLDEIIIDAITAPELDDNTFLGIALNGYLYVPDESVEDYQSKWSTLIEDYGWVINQEKKQIDVNYGEFTTVSANKGSFPLFISSNIDWTIQTENCSAENYDPASGHYPVEGGNGDAVVYIRYGEWFTYYGPRTLNITINSELGEKVITITQEAEAPWITFSSSTNKIAHTGGTVVFNNYAAVTNCEEVTLSVSEGTVTPTIHNGNWGETTSMDLVWEIPETQEERNLTITGTAEVSDGTTITGTFNVRQLSPHTFSADTGALRWIDIDGGDYTMEYTTDVSSIELSLTKVPDFVTGFSYTQPVNGVGTFTVTYADAHYTLGRYSHPVVVALYDGIQIGTARLDDYQLGTGFWLPDIEQTISYEEQVIEVKIHNASCDLQESNLSLHQSVPGLTVVSYTPQTTHTSTDFGILYVKVPHNPGKTRTFTIKVDALNNEGVVFDSDTGVTITQLEIPPIIYVDLEVDAGYNKVEVDHSLYGDWWVLSKVNWVKAETRDGSDPGIVTVIVGGNPTKDARVGYVHIYGETQTYIITITQAAIDFSFDPDGDLIPICDEITYSENSDKIDYLVLDQEYEGLRYVGRAHKYPDSDSVVIELNDIFSDTLRNNILFTEGLQEMNGYMKKFGIQNQNTGKGRIYYSYKAWERPVWPLLNDPISNVIDPRQYLFVNYIDGYGLITLLRNGETVGSLDKKAGCAYLAPREDAICGEEVWFDVKLGETVLAVQNYIYQQTNKNYALYYINAYGGWDSLAIRGNVTQTDNIQSQTYKNKTNGKVKYLNQITPTWSLNTDAISDASKMHHLLESTQVYLHNLETDEIIPVVITDTSCVYKTYSNQGNTRFYYTINVEASNYKIRK